ncbi:formyltransferase family protein [Waltera sp.]|jgi:methionyl-tRNA formyltransferase|uniref:formyltransferase family protein n=1 Tax=Waltera sp. TaxID=2815806 RepID=UPI000338CEFD|nr:methionyl-tRNA formyltransferase [Clostridium sp. CAG:91]
MRIFYIGCVKSSYVFLKELLENDADVVGVITKETSSFNADFVDMAPLCKKYGIPYLFIHNVNDDEAVEFIKKCHPDIGYCFGWSQLIKNDVIKIFPMGMVGYHPAALPNNRGRHPIIWALALGLTETASSFFMIEKDADTGDIISQEKVEITYEDDAKTLMDKLLTCGAKQVVSITEKFEYGGIKRVSQKQGNNWRKRGKSDGQIDWRMSSRTIYNLVRALAKPYVGAHFMLGEDEVKVWKVREVIDQDNNYVNIEPGKIIDVNEENIIVKTGDNLIELLEHTPITVKIGDYL